MVRRFEKPLGAAGLHVIDMQAQTLDEALTVIKRKQIAAKGQKTRKSRPLTLREEFSLNAGRQRIKPVTLSDRTIEGAMTRAMSPPLPKRPAVIWTREQVIQAYQGGRHTISDLAVRSKRSVLQVKRWVFVGGWSPYKYGWRCENCSAMNMNRLDCKRCGEWWNKRLEK